MEDVCRDIDLNKSTQNGDMAIIVLQSLEVRLYLETSQGFSAFYDVTPIYIYNYIYTYMYMCYLFVKLGLININIVDKVGLIFINITKYEGYW